MQFVKVDLIHSDQLDDMGSREYYYMPVKGAVILEAFSLMAIENGIWILGEKSVYSAQNGGKA